MHFEILTFWKPRKTAEEKSVIKFHSVTAEEKLSLQRKLHNKHNIASQKQLHRSSNITLRETQ